MNQPKKKDALGKGIRSLLQNIDNELKVTGGSLTSDVADKSAIGHRIPIELIEPNPDQPRTDFDKEALNELATSIKIHNIIQPLTVAAIGNGKYRLIAGERRYRASKIAGLKDVPVYIRETKGSNILELSLLENLQRENLNAIEIALTYKRLVDELEYTQEQLAERMGKERSTVTNYLRLLKLPPDIQVAVRNGELTMGHARALVNVDDVDKQLFVFKQVKEKALSVRQTEELVRKLYSGEKPAGKKTSTSSLPPAFKKIEDNLASNFGTKVRMSHSKAGNGSILFEYYSIDELNALLDKLKVTVS